MAVEVHQPAMMAKTCAMMGQDGALQGYGCVQTAQPGSPPAWCFGSGTLAPKWAPRGWSPYAVSIERTLAPALSGLVRMAVEVHQPAMMAKTCAMMGQDGALQGYGCVQTAQPGSPPAWCFGSGTLAPKWAPRGWSPCIGSIERTFAPALSVLERPIIPWPLPLSNQSLATVAVQSVPGHCRCPISPWPLPLSN